MYSKLKDFFLNRRLTLFYLVGLVALISAAQAYFGGLKKFQAEAPEATYTQYNNYIIFKQSFVHFIDGKDLYSLYPEEHWDLYKYSPTFALLFGGLAWLPDWLGLLLWNLINALALFLGVRMLPGLELKARNLIVLLSIVELLTSLQSAQSNALIAGFIVLAFAMMERGKFLWACVLIALTAYIKLFGLFAFALCLLYPQRWRMTFYGALSVVALGVLPLLVVSVPHLASQYQSWWRLLQSDYVPNALSLIGVVKEWTSFALNPNAVLLVGLVLFGLPLLRFPYFDNYKFRLAMLAMVLLWMIVFNHKAESPTFIIAMVGAAVWYFSSGLSVRARNMLILSAFVFTSLSATDVFPDFIQDNFFDPFSVKAIPCIVIYFTVLYELVFKPDQLAHS